MHPAKDRDHTYPGNACEYMSVRDQVLFGGHARVQALAVHMRCRMRTPTAIVLLALMSLLGGCSDGAGSRAAPHSSKLVLGFSQVEAKANWDAANATSIRDAARDAGIELRLEDARRSQHTQVAALRSLVRQRVDVIAFSPVVENGWETVLREIRSARIPVILMDRTIEVT